jgi:hypothetical protein
MLAYSAPALAGTSIAMSGSFAGRHFELAQGGTIDSPDINTVVFNHGDKAIGVRMSATAPQGVQVGFSEQSFTIVPGGYKQVSVTIKAGQYAPAGSYDLVVRAETAPESAEGISIPVAVAQSAKLNVLGTPAAFKDTAGHWARYDIEVMAALGVAHGTGEGQFSPDATVTRAQFASFITSSLGIAQVKPAVSSFRDVSPSAWYYGAVEAAYAGGLVSGANGMFNPDANITREEIAVMIVRGLAKEGITGSAGAPLAAFSDQGDISSWAVDSVQTAAAEGIISGKDGRFAPAESATRAEAVSMLKRMLVRLEKIAQ